MKKGWRLEEERERKAGGGCGERGFATTPHNVRKGGQWPGTIVTLRRTVTLEKAIMFIANAKRLNLG